MPHQRTAAWPRASHVPALVEGGRQRPRARAAHRSRDNKKPPVYIPPRSGSVERKASSPSWLSLRHPGPRCPKHLHAGWPHHSKPHGSLSMPRRRPRCTERVGYRWLLRPVGSATGAIIGAGTQPALPTRHRGCPSPAAGYRRLPCRWVCRGRSRQRRALADPGAPDHRRSPELF